MECWFKTWAVAAAMAVSAAGAGAQNAASAAASGVFAAPVPARPLPPLADCLGQLRRELKAYPSLRAETFDRYTRNLQDLRPAIDTATQSQPEFKLAIWDYVARLADDQRAADGRAVLQREAAALQDIAKTQQVDAATVVAVFGVETDYGRLPGRLSVIDATISRACLRMESKERRAQVFAALQLLQDGVVTVDQFKGSWAGAFGMTQFMPATFARFAEMPDKSRKVDIINNVPDALLTTARFLVSLGWEHGLPWGVEVKAPKNLVAAQSAPEREHACTAQNVGGKCKTVAQWAAAGVTGVAGGALPSDKLPAETRTALLAPAGPEGPVWLVTRNFHAVWGYNRADAYALAIGLIADALRGDPPMKAAWPTDDPGLSRAGFKELQTLLVARGHTDVKPDGHDGPRTQQAVIEEEKALGLPESGRGATKLLERLRAVVPASAAVRASGT